MTLMSWIIALGFAGAAAYVGHAYQRLMKLDARCDQAAAAIDAQFMRRHALLIELIKAVRAFTPHDREAIETVVRARAAALRAPTPQARLLAETTLSDGLRRLLMVAEKSEFLRRSDEFGAFVGELSETERAVARARAELSAAVRSYNSALRQFPFDMLANRLRIARRSFYDIGAEYALFDEAGAAKA